MKRVNLHPFLNLVIYVLLFALLGGVIATITLVAFNLPLSLYSVTGGRTGFYGVLVVVVLVISGVLIYLTQQLDKQHKGGDFSFKKLFKVNFTKNTYLQFLWFSLILSPLILLILKQNATYVNLIKSSFEFTTISLPSWWLLFMLSLLLGALFVTSSFWKKEKKYLRFSPGSTDKDEFGYSEIAAQDMKSIVNTKNHIIVATINGRLGEGKSSYLRMMVGSRPPEELLYTYISLTETNEAKSFSKLFAERWLETLVDRYPSASHAAKQSILENIFRESSNGFMKAVRSIIHSSRWPFRRTRIKYKGDNHPEPPYANKIIAPLFSYVSEFHEDYWVIVIDEVERSRFDEIYRTIETLERFRMEAQWGLPIKLVFVLCIDRIRFKERVSEIPAENEAASLSYSFLEREPKTIDIHIDLPPVPPGKKEAYIIKREKEWLIDKYEINVDSIQDPDTHQKSLEVYWSEEMLDASEFARFKGALDDKRAHDWMMHKLMAQSPRTINKVLEQTDYFMSNFSRSLGDKPAKANKIRVSDLIILNYLKFKHPDALRFLLRVHPLIFPEFHEYQGTNIDSILRRSLRWKTQDKTTFEDFYRSNMKGDLPEKVTSTEIEDIKDLIRYICYPIIEYVESIGNENAKLLYEDEGKAQYENTLALPENLWDALTIATDQKYDTSDFLNTKNNQEYIHKNKKLPSALARSSTQLLLFARNMRRYYPNDYLVSQYLADRIARVLINKGSVKRYPGTLNKETPYSNLTYVFTFHLANYVARDDATPEAVEAAFDLVRRLLKAPSVMVEAKVKILDIIFAYSRTGGTESAIDSDRMRKKFEEKHLPEIKLLMEEVVEKGLDQYLPRGINNRSIYDYEENYFYTMYQLWSGNPNDEEGINRIRKVAANGLLSHPQIIDAYWDTRFSQDRNFLQNAELNITVEDLIKVTRRARRLKKHQHQLEVWKQYKKEDKKSGAITQVSGARGDSTLKLQLRRLGYLGAKQ